MTEARVIPVTIEEEMKRSYIDYAMSVIVGRALPDVRDGLKPVHRRVLYAMHEQGMTPDKPYKKSARVVGDVLGKYHPHGDMAVYDTIVRMVQPFSLRYPLLDGQGNFGSIDGDGAAAMRYTEVRLGRIAVEMLEDIEKDTVDFAPNYDGSLEEPVLLPAKLPNLLVNGSTGIAVGMATNIPPHNLREIVEGIILLIEKPDATLEELMEVIPGPDFPTGGFIYGRDGIRQAYATGRGSVKIRARMEIEEEKGKTRIIVTELPYQVNKARLIEHIAELVRDKKLTGITDLRDESDKEGIRVVIELARGTNARVLQNRLYASTALETTFGVINLALVEGQPRILTLRETIQHYIDHRKDIVTRRSKFELERAEKRAHILEGLKIALDNIDRVISLIRSSRTPEEARNSLITSIGITEEQAKAILEMRLARLTGLERGKIEEEHRELLQKIKRLKEILADEKQVLEIIKTELRELAEKYGDRRRSEIVEDVGELGVEDLIPEEEVVIAITHTGYIKSQSIDTYRRQRRGGRGIIGMETKEEDFVQDLFIASTHDYILAFTDQGRVYWLKVYEIPRAGRHSRGKAIVNLLELGEGENITAMIPVRKFDEGYLFMATRLGTVKKTPLTAFSNPRRTGIIALSLEEDDKLVSVKLTDGTKDVVLVTRQGKAIRFHETDVRDMGRTARGVRGITLSPGDEVVGMDIAEDGASLLTLTREGYGKRTPYTEYRAMHRGGKGVITNSKGSVTDMMTVRDSDEIIVTTSQGIIIRVPVKDIRETGRNTQGVRLIKLQPGDQVRAVARLAKDEVKN